MSIHEIKCSEMVMVEKSHRSLLRYCRNKPTVEKDGKWYCAIHDPAYIKKKGKIKSNELMQVYVRNGVIKNLLDDISTEKLERHFDVIREFIRGLN